MKATSQASWTKWDPTSPNSIQVIELPHSTWTPGGSYAEYAPRPAHTAFHIPNTMSFEEAAAIPFAVMTAAIGLYMRLALYLSHLRRRRSSCHLLFMELHLLLARCRAI